MKVTFIHYHLKTGGVTTAIRRQIEAIGGHCDVLVLTGQAPQEPVSVPVKVIEGLGYDMLYSRLPEPVAIAQAIRDAIHRHFGRGCDVVHVHNPTLAKNRHFMKVLNLLQAEGLKLLLQIHDFAEDGRPLAYFREDYPQDCHYAVINSRDYNLLRRAGGVAGGVHLLPNAVSLPQTKPTGGGPSSYVLYPIRAIRRKNIGEAILLSLFLNPGEHLAITLPPNSPADFDSYHGWKDFVASNHLTVDFDVGLETAFEDLVVNARYLVTTSITEGFGFSFLEPWLFHKTICGRRLPDICADFENRGIDLQHLYHSLMVPFEWIDGDRFHSHWSRAVRQNSRRFDYPVRPERLKTAFEQMTGGRRAIDFGLLSEPFQEQVLGRLLTGQAERIRLVNMNSFLHDFKTLQPPADLVAANRRAILDTYLPAKTAPKLLATYATVAGQAVRQRIDKQRLLDTFFDPAHFSLLKWGSYAR